MSCNQNFGRAFGHSMLVHNVSMIFCVACIKKTIFKASIGLFKIHKA
jgi:hypothetical protein